VLLSCESDWLGRMFYLHPGRVCVSTAPRRYKVDCTACGKPIEVEKRPRSDREYSCGERCASALRIRREGIKRAEVFARWFKVA
jgi:hypothetical protein